MPKRTRSLEDIDAALDQVQRLIIDPQYMQYPGLVINAPVFVEALKIYRLIVKQETTETQP